jgi:hypothetical protein
MRAHFALALCTVAACVPPGNSTPSDAGTTTTNATPTVSARPRADVMSTPFEDNFDRAVMKRDAAPVAPLLPTTADGQAANGPETGLVIAPPMITPDIADDGLAPNWRQAQTNVWHLENGRVCGQMAHNHGLWLNRVLPVNAQIEFDATSDSQLGDLKAEVWGDGQSSATSISYTNATSYLTIMGGWKNKFHVLARINEHGDDRKEITIDPTSDDPREKPVVRGQTYHFKVVRNDGHTVRWSVDGLEYLTYDDPQPLVGFGHDHFGFNDWEVKVCFDNVKVTPLP